MSASFRVNIMTPERSAYEADIVSLIVPAEEGYLGVLAHHAPIIARLKPGNIIVCDKSDKLVNFTLNGTGFLEVSGNSAALLLDSLELPS